jgi:hypothetical protein
LLNHRRTSSIDNEIEESHARRDHDHPARREGVRPRRGLTERATGRRPALLT